MGVGQRGNDDLVEKDLCPSGRIHHPGGELTIVNGDVGPHGHEPQALALDDLTIGRGHREQGLMPAIPQREGQPDEWIEVAVRAPRGDDDTGHWRAGDSRWGRAGHPAGAR